MSGRGRSRCRANGCRASVAAKCRMEVTPAVWIGLCLDHAKRFLNDEVLVLKPHERPRTEAAPERPIASPTEGTACPAQESSSPSSSSSPP